jgi:hypothetical protein
LEWALESVSALESEQASARAWELELALAPAWESERESVRAWELEPALAGA